MYVISEILYEQLNNNHQILSPNFIFILQTVSEIYVYIH